MPDVRLRKKMAKGRHASAVRRHRRSLKLRERNKHFMSHMKSAIKGVRTAIGLKDKDKSKEALKKALSIISHTAQKGIIPKSTANRYKSRLTIAVNHL